jgi:hypothetical protein
VKLPPELQSVLVDSKPNVFVPAAGAWGRSGWTYIELAQARLAEVKELVAEAWRLVAPKRLVASQTKRTKAPPKRASKKA